MRPPGRNQSRLASCLKVLDEQRANEFGRLYLRKVSDGRRVVQHIDAGGWSLLPNPRKDVGSTNWVGGAPDESLWARIAFDNVRPSDGMLAAFSHVAKQRGSHPCSPRPAEIDPHLAERMVGHPSAQQAQKRCTISGFGNVLLGLVSAEFTKVSLRFSRSMQIREHPPIEPGHRLNPGSVTRQEFLCYRNTVIMCD